MKQLTIAFFFIIFYSFSINSQVIEIDFFRPEQEEILSKGIRCLHKDRNGFLWIGTAQGLFRFDGYSYKSYTYQQGNKRSLCDNNVYSLLEDTEGNLWIGTHNGLSKYDKKHDDFKNYTVGVTDSFYYNSNQIKDLLIDHQQRFWVARNNAISLYIPKKDSFIIYSNHLPSGIKAGRNITKIVSDLRNNIWIGTWNAGIIKFDTNTKKFFSIDEKLGNSENLRSKQIISLAITDSLLWFGHRDKGFGQLNINNMNISYSLHDKTVKETGESFNRIFVDKVGDTWLYNDNAIAIYNPESFQLRKINNNHFLENTFKTTKISFLYIDADSILWVNRIDEGLVCYHPYANNFAKYYKKLPRERKDIIQNYVKSFIEDPAGNLWIATFDDGLIKLNKDGSFKRFVSGTKMFTSNKITHLLLDNQNKIWVSTSNGIIIIDPLSEKVENRFAVQKNGINGLYFNFVLKVFQDSRNNYWIINQEGLDFYNPSENTFRHFNQNNLGGFSHYKFTSIDEDKDGNLWFGTENGLNKFDYKKKTISSYFHIPDVNSSLSNSQINYVKYINKHLWICTANGLNEFDFQKEKFLRLEHLEQVVGKNVSGVLEDDDKDFIWIISESGLSKYNTVSQKVVNYGKFENLNISDETFYRTKERKFYLGGAHEDYYTFYPKQIKINPKIPPVYITNFLLFNKPVLVSTDQINTPLLENIINTKSIKLKYFQNSFGFEFTALNYLIPEKNQFAYKLEGFDKDWSFTDFKRRYANYTNLHPGDYIFCVRACNNDGIWNEEGAKLRIHIASPYWLTWYAYLFYFTLLVFILYLARRITIQQTRLKSLYETEHLLREHEEETHKQRITFFTNISHEFRTPLTLIAGPLKQIDKLSKKEAWDTELLDYFDLIKRNVKRLTELTNQLLDFRKVEAGKDRLMLYQGDIILFIRSLAETFSKFAQKKKIELRFESEVSSLNAFFDMDKIEKIVSNLISNALKFTEEGSIVVSVKEISQADLKGITKGSRCVEIAVSDTGIGIPEDQLKKIFNPFHQVEISRSGKTEGTGLGLALTASLVALCNGEINVKSQLGKGSVFTIIIPIDKESFQNFTLIEQIKAEFNSRIENDYDKSVSKTSSTNLKNDKKATVLIVDDNPDLCLYIRKILEKDYLVVEATDGLKGLELAVELMPDLIISDIMMTGLSGTDMTLKLKADERTNHIPVILLTALVSTNHKIYGLSAGADDYITKPFNEELLRLKVRNLLKNRQKMKEYLLKQIHSAPFRSVSTIQPSEPKLENAEEQFINKLLKIIESNIQEVDFGVEKLAREVGMEASTLYKKMMLMLDISPGEFIKVIRLKRAAQLLSKKELSVTEVSFMVGYEDPKYFSKIFKKYYGITPTDFRNKLD